MRASPAPAAFAAGAFALLTLATLAGTTACTGDRDPAGPVRLEAGTPIVLVSIDTLRSDRLPAYGYAAGSTPAIDALREDSVLFERAYSHVPLTLPAHASLLTGLLPPEHRVRDNTGFRLDAEAHPSLPRFLKERGYATGASVSAFVMRGATGLASGFDLYDDAIESRQGFGTGGVQRPGTETLRAARGWLESVAGEPFFFFLHLYEPHAPHEPPPAFAGLPTPYDGEVAAADAVVGELVAELERLGVYDRALVVLLSDHGEGLGDHGEREHGLLLYREALQVPLLVKLPGGERGGGTVAEPVGLVDLFPTIAGLLGVETPAGLPGRPLFSAPGKDDRDNKDSKDGEDGEARQIYAETFYPRLHFGWSELASLVEGRFHYIHGPDPELYDVVADPAERTRVLEQNRRVYARLRESVEGFDLAPPTPGAEDEETRRQLAALGYLAGGAAGPAEGELPDPKSRLHVVEELRAAFRLGAERDFPRAAEAFRKIAAENPRMLDAWDAYARALAEQGRTDEALAAYQKALEISNGAPHLALGAADLYLAAGRLGEAKAHAALAVELDPVGAHEALARIALADERLDEAERHARQAADARGRLLSPLATLARVLGERGKADEGLKLADQALAEAAGRARSDPEALRGLHLLRGNLLARLGDGPRAEQAFQEEIRRFPDAAQAYAELAVLYAVQGRPQDTAATLKQLVDRNNTPAAYATAARTLEVLGDRRSAEALRRHARTLFSEGAGR